MLDVGFSELLLIAVAALLVIGPKDLPVVIRHVMKFLREMRAILSGLKQQMTDMVEEAGLDDLKKDMTTIIDMEGNSQAAYDVSELQNLSAKPKTDV
ncbi:MAG: Sec-independent protein translocase protein TatB [Rickettsiales bacterium]